MTMSQFQAIPTITADADWRALLTNYRAALTAAGFVRTSDTGQLDPTTVLKPGASSISGYDVWRFNDDAQATKPIFFKLEYGAGSSAARFNLWITVGTGSDGAGNITDIRIPRSVMGQSSNSAILADVWVSGGEGYLASVFYAGPSTPASALGWMIDRVRLQSGLPDLTTLGAGIVSGISNNQWQFSTYDGVWSESGSWPTVTPQTTYQYRGVTYAYPYYPVAGALRPPIRSAIAVNPLDAGYSAPFTVSLYSTPHVFRGFSGTIANVGRGVSTACAFRYE